MNEITRIEEIMHQVRQDWVANDGGLTITASDALLFGNMIVKFLENEDANSIMAIDPNEFGTAENEILEIAQDWARERARFQVSKGWSIGPHSDYLVGEFTLNEAIQVANEVNGIVWYYNSRGEAESI